jgi:hypothetical protein
MTQPELIALSAHRPALAAAMSPWWSTPVAQYSAALWRPPPPGVVEPELVAALSAELERLGSGDVLPQLLARRVLATAHHVTPTNGPTFLALDAILTASGQTGIVAAYSGVAFSNSAWSGALSFSSDPEAILRPDRPLWRQFQSAARDRARDGEAERRVSLIPARWRDGLVYRHPLPDGLHRLMDDLTDPVRVHLPDDAPDWPTWALRACASIQRAVLGAPLVYLDLNRVIAGYLTAVLANPDHPLTRLLLHAETRRALCERLPQPWFYTSRVSRGSEKLDPLRPDGDWLTGRGGARIRLEAAALQDALRDGVLCPGLMLCFATLGILNPFRCLGSFNQIAYQSAFAEHFSALSVADAPADPGPVLLTGRLVGADGPIYPLDLLTAQHRLPLTEDWPMSRLWRPIVARLLE